MLKRRWNASLRLGAGGYDEYVTAVNQPGEAPNDLRMPNVTSDGAVKVKELDDCPDDGILTSTPLFEFPERVQQHEFVDELKRNKIPFGIDPAAYLFAPIDDKMQNRLRCHETNFRKAGISARHLMFLTDLWASERFPWDSSRFGWHGQVTNMLYQSIAAERSFNRYGAQW
jgi:hypothetical protein